MGLLSVGAGSREPGRHSWTRDLWPPRKNVVVTCSHRLYSLFWPPQETEAREGPPWVSRCSVGPTRRSAELGTPSASPPSASLSLSASGCCLQGEGCPRPPGCARCPWRGWGRWKGVCADPPAWAPLSPGARTTPHPCSPAAGSFLPKGNAIDVHECPQCPSAGGRGAEDGAPLPQSQRRGPGCPPVSIRAMLGWTHCPPHTHPQPHQPPSPSAPATGRPFPTWLGASHLGLVSVSWAA